MLLKGCRRGGQGLGVRCHSSSVWGQHHHMTTDPTKKKQKLTWQSIRSAISPGPGPPVTHDGSQAELV